MINLARLPYLQITIRVKHEPQKGDSAPLSHILERPICFHHLGILRELRTQHSMNPLVQLVRHLLAQVFTTTGINGKKPKHTRHPKTSLSFDITCINVMLFCQGITSGASSTKEPLLSGHIKSRFHNCKRAYLTLAADKKHNTIIQQFRL